MDGDLIHTVVDVCTPTNMSKAGVPSKLADWYQDVGRHLKFLSSTEVEKVMRIRTMVRNARV